MTPVQNSTQKRAGFSLIELSIVLVILGLLAGGILAGQSLIRAAELRATVKQLTDSQQQLAMFQDKYFSIPGDFNIASRFWTGAVDGNGNGKVETASAGSYGIDSPDQSMYDGERRNYFVHLGLAGLTQAYTGTNVPNIGLPAIKRAPTKAMFMTGPWNSSGGGNYNIDTWMRGRLYAAMMVCNTAQLNTSSSQHNDCGTFIAEEVWNMDTKLDDGKPMSGKLIAQAYDMAGGTPLCFTTSNNSYILTETATNCNLALELMP
jgi:prepilin-type N-terminal cleavage/methylation domain-containing protein